MRKRIASALLIAILFVAMPIQLLAAQDDLRHTHSYDEYVTTFVEYIGSANYHVKFVTVRYKCDCGAFYDINEEEKSEEHVKGTFSYTGNNYHSGSRHYFEYEGSCILCDQPLSEWRFYSCPGNPCILPQSIKIEMDKK